MLGLSSMLVADFCASPFLALFEESFVMVSEIAWALGLLIGVDEYIILGQCAVQGSTRNVFWHSRKSRLTMAGCLCNSKTNQISSNAISEVPKTSTERWFQFDNSTSLDEHAVSERNIH